jgi:hypothetical protein
VLVHGVHAQKVIFQAVRGFFIRNVGHQPLFVGGMVSQDRSPKRLRRAPPSSRRPEVNKSITPQSGRSGCGTGPNDVVCGGVALIPAGATATLLGRKNA